MYRYAELSFLSPNDTEIYISAEAYDFPCPWPLSSVFFLKPKPLRKIPGMKEQVFAFGYIVCYNGHDICENDVPQGVSVRGLHAAEIGQRLK